MAEIRIDCEWRGVPIVGSRDNKRDDDKSFLLTSTRPYKITFLSSHDPIRSVKVA